MIALAKLNDIQTTMFQKAQARYDALTTKPIVLRDVRMANSEERIYFVESITQRAGVEYQIFHKVVYDCVAKRFTCDCKNQNKDICYHRYAAYLAHDRYVMNDRANRAAFDARYSDESYSGDIIED